MDTLVGRSFLSAPFLVVDCFALVAANLLDAKRAFGLVDLFLYLLRDVVALTLTLELEDDGLLAFDQWGETCNSKPR